MHCQCEQKQYLVWNWEWFLECIRCNLWPERDDDGNLKSN